ncbi:MAG: mechanosensitive ion channel family protein [Chromatiales bacterium]|nr:mechanosensitive ion channel family protein [Chromatiales bacterium]
MELLLLSLRDFWQEMLGMAPRILIALSVLALSYVLGRYLARLASMALGRSALQELHHRFFRVAIIILSVFGGMIVALNVLGLEKVAVSMLAGGGVTAVVLGFAFREIGENFLAGLFLTFSRPFNVGDLIVTGEIEGTVKDIELRYTHIRTDDGRDAFVPSSQLFNSPVINFTRDGLRRSSFTVGIDYANDAKLACDFLKKAVGRARGVLSDPSPGVFISELADSFVVLKAWYWVDALKKNQSLTDIKTEVLDNCRIALLENGYTVSAETTSNIAVVRMPGGPSAPGEQSA